MTRTIVRAATALVLAGACVGAGDRAATGSASVSADGLKGLQFPANDRVYNFKLKAGGRFDPVASIITFAGHATHLGQFTATAYVNPNDGFLNGTVTLAGGETLALFGRTFVIPQMGINTFMRIGPGAAPFADTEARSTGMLALDEDSLFALELEGSITFVDQSPCLGEPCF